MERKGLLEPGEVPVTRRTIRAINKQIAEENKGKVKSLPKSFQKRIKKFSEKV